MDRGNYEVAVAYSDPYGVYLPQEILSEIGADPGAPVRLVFEEDEGETEIIAKAREQDVMRSDDEVHPFLEQEVHALFYGIANIIDDLPSGFENSFSQFQGDQPTEIEIDELQDLAAYLNELATNVTRFTQEHVIVGCGFFELFLKGERDTEHTVQTPLFQIDTPTFKELLNGQFPPLTRIEPYEGDIGEPDTVYFCTEYFAASDQQKERLREAIAEYEFVSPAGDYVVPHHYLTAHGPLPTENLQDEPSIIRVTPDTIEFTAAQFGAILPADGETVFDFDQVSPIITDVFDQDDIKIDRSPEDNQITLHTSDIRITFYVFDTELRYSYLHVTDSDTIAAIEEALNALPQLLDEQLGIETIKTPTDTNELAENVDRDTWILDTNALYHEIPGQGPSSIMHLFFPHLNLYGKQIVVPWQVLAEINRHKDERTALQTASEQGIENLRIFRLLDEYGFIDLDIGPIPTEFDSSIVPETGATDLAILAAATAADDGILLTRDERLIDLCTIMETPVEHVEFLTSLQPEEDDYELFADVTQELEEPQTRDDLLAYVDERVQMRNEEREYGEAQVEDAQEMLQTWRDEREIIPYRVDNTVYMAQAATVDIVPSYSLLRNLAEYIDSDLHLTEGFLEAMQGSAQLPSEKYPWVHFHIPEEYVYQAMQEASKEDEEQSTLTTLYQVEQLENADYSSIPLVLDEVRNPDLEKVAVRAAKEAECSLVCLEDESIRRLARLLDAPISPIRLEN